MNEKKYLCLLFTFASCVCMEGPGEKTPLARAPKSHKRIAAQLNKIKDEADEINAALVMAHSKNDSQAVLELTIRSLELLQRTRAIQINDDQTPRTFWACCCPWGRSKK